MRTDTFTVTTALVVLAVTTAVSVVRADCPSSRASLLTFNTGLSPTVPKYADRRANIVTNVQTQFNSADFVCLQEVWYEKDVKALVDKLEGDFPYHFSAIHSSVGELRNSRRRGILDWLLPGRKTVPCGVVELGKLTMCLGWYCLTASDLQQCTMDKCASYVYDMSLDCRACLVVSSTGITTVAAKCADKTDTFNRINRPGLLVLSKQPLVQAEYINFWEGKNVLLERGYINGKVAGVNPNYLCTHLSSSLRNFDEKNLPQFDGYKEQQAGEIEQLRNFHASQFVILGDFNTGPARNESGLAELNAEWPDNYGLLTEDFANPYLENGGACTYCPSENPAPKPGALDVAIDYILTKNVNSDVTSAQRVLDGVDILLSDHFGVQLDICLP